MNRNDTKALNRHYMGMQATYWIVASVLSTFLVPLLRQQGFESGQIGILLAIRCLSSIFFQAFYSSYADKRGDIANKYFICFFGLMAMGLTLIHAFAPMNFPVAVLIFIGYGASLNCILSFIDSLSVQYISRGVPIKYSTARALGSFTWAATALVLGFSVERFDIKALFPIQFVCLIILLVITFTSVDPKNISVETEGNAVKEKRECQSIGSILKNYPFFTIFLISVALIFLANNMTINYMAYKVEALNGSSMELGFSQFMLGFAELFAPIFFGYFSKKLGIRKLILLAYSFHLLRIVIWYFADSMAWVYVAQSTQVLGSMFWAGSVRLVYETIPENDRIKGQAMVSIAHTGIGACIGSVLGGALMQSFQTVNAINMAALICSAAGMTIYTFGYFFFRKQGNERVVRFEAKKDEEAAFGRT